MARLLLTAQVAFFMLQDNAHAPDNARPIEWWVVDSLAKVRPLDKVPVPLIKTADISAGRNEFEPFQIVLHSVGQDTVDIDVDVSDLRTIGGAIISKSNVIVYFQRFVDLIQPSSIEGAPGLWPDPLVPRVDRYFSEKRNAFPFSLRRGHNQPLWVEVYVPATALPGNYSGSVRISRRGDLLFSVPIRLEVWAFTLPSTASLRSSFGLNGMKVLKAHRGRYTNDDDLFALTRTYSKAALLHRVSIHGGTMVPPRFRQEPDNKTIDWAAYDAEVGPFLNGTLIPAGEPLHGARATSVELRTPSAFPDEASQLLYWAAWVKHFREKGWLDRLFLYLWDEPTQADYPKVLDRGRSAARAHPRIRSLVTIPYTGTLAEIVHVWAPLVNCLVLKPGFDDFCSATPPHKVYQKEIQRGKSLWFYQSCASHGCNIVGGPYFSGWPSYVIDASGAANRIMQWLAWRFQIEGELYFNMTEAFGDNSDPWTSIRLFGGNGDGTLFYPGRPDRIGGSTDIPIESIRLKLIREGMEDYEYLALLSKLGDRSGAFEYAGQIVKAPYLWESSSEMILKVRRELGETLHRLTVRRNVSTNDAK